MNLLLLYPSEQKDGLFIISGKRYGLVMRDHDLSPGLCICSGIANGAIGTATVTDLGKDSITIHFEASTQPPCKLPVILAVGFCRPQAAKRVLQLAAQSGVAELHFFDTELCEKSYQQSAVFGEEELAYQLQLGLEQAKDTVFPKVTLWKKFWQFEKWLGSDTVPGNKILADTILLETSATPIRVTNDVLFVVGGERGFTEVEKNKFKQLNFSSVHLGDRILKVDVACAFLLGGYITLLQNR